MYAKRIIGIDYGRKRIGLACSDPLRITAQPLPTLTLKTQEDAATRVCQAIAQLEIELLVVGLPVSLTGETGGAMAKEIKKFARDLERNGYSTVLEDESFTSQEAMATLRLAGKKEKQMRGKTDSIAAQLILQDYLDAHQKEWK